MKDNIKFQGSLRKHKYFEGWYFKHVSKDKEKVLSIIPGIALDDNRIAFIQIINGITGETSFVEYPIESFKFNKNSFSIQIGKSFFSEKKILLNIDKGNIKVTGEIAYSNLSRFEGDFKIPNVMGWYAYVPGMECKHGLLSMNHELEGELMVNMEKIDFNGGKGYIEKDYGKSFPESWMWLQCNHFEKEDVSLMISIAKIPWLGNFFIGHLCIIKFGDKVYNLSKYTGAKIVDFKNEGELVFVNVRNKGYDLELKITPRVSGELVAPVNGKMNRYIKESIDSIVEVNFKERNGNLIFKDTGQRAGLELIEKIFSYF